MYVYRHIICEDPGINALLRDLCQVPEALAWGTRCKDSVSCFSGRLENSEVSYVYVYIYDICIYIYMYSFIVMLSDVVCISIFYIDVYTHLLDGMKAFGLYNLDDSSALAVAEIHKQ